MLQICIARRFNGYFHVWILHILLREIKYEWSLATTLLFRLQRLLVLRALLDSWYNRFLCFLDFHSTHLQCCQKWMIHFSITYILPLRIRLVNVINWGCGTGEKFQSNENESKKDCLEVSMKFCYHFKLIEIRFAYRLSKE